MRHELRLRSMSAVALVMLVLASMAFEWTFCILLLTVAIGMMMEWRHMTKGKDLAAGTLICLAPAISLGLLRHLGACYTATYFACLWAVDTCAFFGGKTFKGPKLLPKISPKKTWSGLVSGIIGCFVSLMVCNFYYSQSGNHCFKTKTLFLWLFAVVFTLLAQAGDLLVSKYKRTYRVKDTGKIIPGHGGLLDRFDGTIFTSAACLIVSLLSF